jgi:hypothetical protein
VSITIRIVVSYLILRPYKILEIMVLYVFEILIYFDL